VEDLGNIIQNLLNDLGIQKKVKHYRAMEVWADVVGERIAKVTEPVRVDHGKLFVRVHNAPWRNELTFLKRNILNNLNNTLDGRVIKDIIWL
jgi:predicted nucleic acid-binding Zn ribbon protein